MAHLEVLLDRPSSAVPLNGPLIAEAQQVLVRMPIADRVYTLMKTRAESAGYPPWIASERGGGTRWGSQTFARPTTRRE